MKKRLRAVCGIIIFTLLMSVTIETSTKASTDTPTVNGSNLTHDSESTGYATKLTRGDDLLVGYSKVVRLGPEKLYAGGTTLAAHTVERVKIAIIVERVKSEEGTWEFVDAWQAELLNASRVAANRELHVEGDYYYRVRSIHSAGADISSSFTDGVYIEKP